MNIAFVRDSFPASPSEALRLVDGIKAPLAPEPLPLEPPEANQEQQQRRTAT